MRLRDDRVVKIRSAFCAIHEPSVIGGEISHEGYLTWCQGLRFPHDAPFPTLRHHLGNRRMCKREVLHPDEIDAEEVNLIGKKSELLPMSVLPTRQAPAVLANILPPPQTETRIRANRIRLAERAVVVSFHVTVPMRSKPHAPSRTMRPASKERAGKTGGRGESQITTPGAILRGMATTR